MSKIPAGALAIAILAIFGGTAYAAKGDVCQWTGRDWACGDGNIVTQHVSETVGPQMIVTPYATPTPTGQPAHRYEGQRPQ